MKKMKAPKSAIKESFGDRVLNFITALLLFVAIIIVGYPVLYVVSCSFSSSMALEAGRVFLWPVDFTLNAYKFVLQYKSVWIGFRNSVFYTCFGVVLEMTITLLVAYPLSRRDFQGKKTYTMLFYMTTRISAGLIPGFLLRCSLGLYNSIWAILISGTVSVSNIFIMRTAISSNIPGELFDAAMIDGANHFQCLVKLAIPLTKATISVLVLYVVVAHWNEYFNAMIYLQDKNLYPLQLVLRPIMTAASAMNQIDVSNMSTASQMQADKGLENVRYALIIISTVPVLAAYAVVQKYFKGGVMMGSVKG